MTLARHENEGENKQRRHICAEQRTEKLCVNVILGLICRLIVPVNTFLYIFLLVVVVCFALTNKSKTPNNHVSWNKTGA